MSNVLHMQLTADASHTIHLTLPPEMGDEVDVIVRPRSSLIATAQQERLVVTQLIDDSGLTKNILNSTEEDCWNDL